VIASTVAADDPDRSAFRVDSDDHVLAIGLARAAVVLD
jgi:hypothetical protein